MGPTVSLLYGSSFLSLRTNLSLPQQASVPQQQLVNLQYYHGKRDMTARNIFKNIGRERSRQGLLVVHPKYRLNCVFEDPVPHKKGSEAAPCVSNSPCV